MKRPLGKSSCVVSDIVTATYCTFVRCSVILTHCSQCRDSLADFSVVCSHCSPLPWLVVSIVLRILLIHCHNTVNPFNLVSIKFSIFTP